MARSAIGKMFKGSVQPALEQTTQFIDQSAMRPETMMRTPEERLLFHTRENQQLANQGLIAPESILPKAYLDADQAKDIYEADMLDAVAARRLHPSIQEELSLIRSGLPKEFVKGSQVTGERKVREGDYDVTYTDRTNTTPEETVMADPKLGGSPRVFYGRNKNTATTITDREPTPEYKAKLKRQGKTFANTVEPLRKKFLSNEDVMDKYVNSVDKYFRALGFDDSRRNSINNAVMELAGEEFNDMDELKDRLEALDVNVSDLSPDRVTAINKALAEYNSLFDEHPVVSMNSNSQTVRQLRRDYEGQREGLKIRGMTTNGQPTTVDVPLYIERDTNRKFWQVPTDHGDIMIAADELDNYNEEMKRNYMKSTPEGRQYLLKVNPESLSIIKGEEYNYKKEEDFYAKNTERINGMFEKYDRVFANDGEYKQLKMKDDDYTKDMLSKFYHKDDGSVNETTPEYEDVMESTKYDRDGKSTNEQNAIIKAALLKKALKRPDAVYIKKTGPDTYEVSNNVWRSRFLQKNFTNKSRGKLLLDATEVAKDVDVRMVTDDGEDTALDTKIVTEDGQIKARTTDNTGKVFTVSAGHVANKDNVKEAMIKSGELATQSMEEQGVVPKNTSVGEARTFHKIPKNGSK